MKKGLVNKSFVMALVVLVMGLLLASTVLAEGPPKKSERPIFWTYSIGSNPVGTSNLLRTGDGISANFQTTGLTPGHAVTQWFVVWNYPELCTGGGPGVCNPKDMGKDKPAQGDFMFASGHVIGEDGKGNFGGHLNAGDNAGSGYAEINCPVTKDCSTGLTNVDGALIVLSVHDHGPALTGQALKDQISTFTGDCYAGNESPPFGFAAGPEDIPTEPGKCSTIQMSPHMPMATP